MEKRLHNVIEQCSQIAHHTQYWRCTRCWPEESSCTTVTMRFTMKHRYYFTDERVLGITPSILRDDGGPTTIGQVALDWTTVHSDRTHKYNNKYSMTCLWSVQKCALLMTVRMLGDLTPHFVTQKNRSVRLLLGHYSFDFKVEARCKGGQAPYRADCIPWKPVFCYCACGTNK